MKRAIINKSRILSVAGALCMVPALLLLESTAAAGIFSLAAMVLLIAGGIYADSRTDCIAAGIMLWAGHVVRFCGLFGTKFLYTCFAAMILLAYSGFLFMGILAARRLRSTKKVFLSVLAVPLTYTLLAYICTNIHMGFITNLTSYVTCIPFFAADLSWLGEYGMTFAVVLMLSCMAELLAEILSGTERKKGILCTGISALIILVLLLIGIPLSGRSGEPDYTFRMALATSQEMDYSGEVGKFYTEDQQMEMFERALEKAVQEDARVLVLNEEYFGWSMDGSDVLYEQLSALVKQYGIPVLAGIELVADDELNINETVFVDSDGQMLCTYIKNNLVPFVEAGDYYDGSEPPVLIETDIDGHKLCLTNIICFDINDDTTLRQIPPDTELVIVPSWDWDTVNIEQKRTYSRAAMMGATMVKHTFDGFSYVSSPEGRCITMLDLRRDYEDVVVVDVPIWQK